MKKVLALFLILTSIELKAQVTGSFIVNGDIDKFYPVTFMDGGWTSNVATELAIGRSSVHTDATWRGSVVANFRYHINNWGHQSNFIDADIKQFNFYHPTQSNTFIAGWLDVSNANASTAIIIWLRGGGTTYYYNSNYTVTPTVYDNNQNSLPYAETIGSPVTNTIYHTYKTAIESYVNNTGLSHNYTAYFNGTGTNYFNGNVGIGTTSPSEKLSVNGNILSKKVRVTQTGWADYVFHPTYQLPTLNEVEVYIKEHRHLKDIPSDQEVEKNGLDLGDTQSALLRKIEELTLYAIQQQKEIEELKKENNTLQQLQSEINQIKQLLTTK